METTYQKLVKLRTLPEKKLRELWAHIFETEAPQNASIAMMAMRLAPRMSDDMLKAEGFPSPKLKKLRYIPQPGRQRIRHYKGKDYIVNETKYGLEFNNKVYKSYSSIANEITGQQRNGLEFFRIKK